jgi:hypothetical protein
MRTEIKVLACLTGVIVPGWLALQGIASADTTNPTDETFTQTATIPVTGGLNSFDIGFVDADIHTYVRLTARTKRSMSSIRTAIP